ncbi:3693_t:CDS:2 [Acaulospora colombiana]|uniref:3693_t:CDS:1 n=1 Tax=Acaulospora colombiana TaxID=27376 RepID=A0ACA9KPV3_9GLOM|nr:3693_t:CDS:2 [Acaulospora colombiana]
MVDLNFFEKVDSALGEEANRKDGILCLVREYERTSRNITAILNRVHSAQTEEVIVQAAIEKFEEVKQHLSNLAQVVPYQKFYRYNELWTRTVQTSIFHASFVVYLTSERLITPDEIEPMFGVRVNLKNDLQDFHISLDEFLHGYTMLTSELVSELLSLLAINSVTLGNYDRPLRISRFVKELFMGFQLLNLKNDALRKKFDGIKYDIKKIEEVVYDISLRKLSRNSNSEDAGVRSE